VGPPGTLAAVSALGHQPGLGFGGDVGLVAVAPQRTDRLPVRQPLQGLHTITRSDHPSGHRRMPATLAGDISKQLRREQVLAVVGKKGIHRPLREQVAAPGRRVQLLIG
jgi:hypothetical protein